MSSILFPLISFLLHIYMLLFYCINSWFPPAFLGRMKLSISRSPMSPIHSSTIPSFLFQPESLAPLTSDTACSSLSVISQPRIRQFFPESKSIPQPSTPSPTLGHCRAPVITCISVCNEPAWDFFGQDCSIPRER